MTPDEIKPGVPRAFELPVRRPDQAGADADAELSSVLEEHARHLMSRGMPEPVARAEALRRLGQPLPEAAARLHRSAERRERTMKAHEWLEDLAGDLRYALRTLRRAPSLAIAATLTLALAIGANTAIFSAVSAVMLRPLPFTQPDRLVMLWESNPDFHWVNQSAAPANLLDWKEQAGAFTDIAGYPSFSGSTTLTGHGEPRLLKATPVTGNFFSVLGVKPVLGRTFRDEETWATDGTPRVVMLAYRTWRDVFGADRALVGKTLQLSGRTVEVIGVLPASFSFPGLDAEVWQSVRWDLANRSAPWFRRAHWMLPVARLKPGVTLASTPPPTPTWARG